MPVLSNILSVTLLAVSPEDRVIQAMRHLSPEPRDSGDWTWAILAVAALVTAGGIAALAISYHNARTRAAWAAFYRHADRMGLTREEISVLSCITRLSGTRMFTSVFTIDSIFERGCEAMLASKLVQQATPQQQQATDRLIHSIREKLGFRLPDDAEFTPSGSSRHISEGCKIAVVHRGASDPVHATVVSANRSELVVEPDRPLDCKPGEAWLIRYTDGGSIWEFDAPVVSNDGEKIVLGHSDRVRFINRRRFPRIPTHRPAHIAAFPFALPEGRELPEFVPAILTEIAGPGMRMEAPLTVRTGQRVLVVITLNPSRVIQALAKVRRATATPDGVSDIAVELTGLSSSELTELAAETNAAAKSGARLSKPALQPAGA